MAYERHFLQFMTLSFELNHDCINTQLVAELHHVMTVTATCLIAKMTLKLKVLPKFNEKGQNAQLSTEFGEDWTKTAAAIVFHSRNWAFLDLCDLAVTLTLKQFLPKVNGHDSTQRRNFLQIFIKFQLKLRPGSCPEKPAIG